MKLTITCNKHPRYKAVYAPRTGCEDCRVLYNLRQQPRKTVVITESFLQMLRGVK